MRLINDIDSQIQNGNFKYKLSELWDAAKKRIKKAVMQIQMERKVK